MILLFYLLLRWTMILILAIVIFGAVLVYFVCWGLFVICKMIVEAAEESPPRGGQTIPQSRWSDRR